MKRKEWRKLFDAPGIRIINNLLVSWKLKKESWEKYTSWLFFWRRKEREKISTRIFVALGLSLLRACVVVSFSWKTHKIIWLVADWLMHGYFSNRQSVLVLIWIFTDVGFLKHVCQLLFDSIYLKSNQDFVEFVSWLVIYLRCWRFGKIFSMGSGKQCYEHSLGDHESSSLRVGGLFDIDSAASGGWRKRRQAAAASTPEERK